VTPAAQLRTFIGALPPKTGKLFAALRAALRKRFPTANEMAYNYSHSVMISYSPTEWGKDGIVAIATCDSGVRLYLSGGKRLKDPKKLLQGSGNTRYVLVAGVRELSKPDQKALIASAVAQAKIPFPKKGKGELFIRGAGAK
jgi:hypothetical protein